MYGDISSGLKNNVWIKNDARGWLTNDKNNCYGSINFAIYDLKTGQKIADEMEETIDAGVYNGKLCRITNGTYTNCPDITISPDKYNFYFFNGKEPKIAYKEDVLQAIKTGDTSDVSYLETAIRLSSTSIQNKNIRAKILRNEKVETEIDLSDYVDVAVSLARQYASALSYAGGYSWPADRVRPSETVYETKANIKCARITEKGWEMILDVNAALWSWPWINYFTDINYDYPAKTWILADTRASVVLKISSEDDKSTVLDSSVTAATSAGTYPDAVVWQMLGRNTKLAKSCHVIKNRYDGYDTTDTQNNIKITYHYHADKFTADIIDVSSINSKEIATDLDFSTAFSLFGKAGYVNVIRAQGGYIAGMFNGDMYLISDNNVITNLTEKQESDTNYHTCYNFRFEKLTGINTVRKNIQKILGYE